MDTKNSRRRGDELLESLFEATIRLAKHTAITELTFQQIADEAQTSRTVLYRRWTGPFDLIQDVYLFKSKKLFDGVFLNEIKDNGSIRKDLLQLLNLYQDAFAEIGPDVINGYYFLRTHKKGMENKPAVHKTAAIKYLEATQNILDRAIARGEKVKKVGKETLMLPFDLIRIENLVRPSNLNRKRLESMVDEVLIPAYLKERPTQR